MPTGDATQSGFIASELGRLKSSPRWAHDPQSKGGTGLVIGNGLVISGMGGGKARALDWATGDIYWETPLGANIAGAPVLYLGEEKALALVPTEDNELHALNLEDGKIVWRKTGAELQGKVVGSMTVTGDGTLYAATDSGWIHAFHSLTGETYWSFRLSPPDRFLTAPAVTNVAIFLAGANRSVYAIDPATRAKAWASKTLGAPTTPPSAVEGLGVILVGTEQGWVQVFSMIAGKQVWAKQASGAIIGPANDGTRVYATSTGGNVYAWNLSAGEEAWVLKMDSALSTAPLTGGKRVIVGMKSGEVRFIDVTSGQEAADFRLKLDAAAVYTPSPAGGWLFVRSSKIYGLGP